MSFGPPTLFRQSHTIDNQASNNINRQSSTTSSSASSGYSTASDSTASSRFSALSSTCNSPRSQHQRQPPTLHKRGLSDVGSLAHTFETMAGAHSPPKRGAPENVYSSMRQSLRPLPQAPASGGTTGAAPSSPRHHTLQQRQRGHSVNVSGTVAPSPPRHLLRHERGQSMGVERSAAPSPPRYSPRNYERGQSIDLGRHASPSPTKRSSPYQHERGQTFDVAKHIAPSPPRLQHERGQTFDVTKHVAPSPPRLQHERGKTFDTAKHVVPSPPRLQHERGKSMDMGGRLSAARGEDARTPTSSPPRHLALRPNSMLLTRSDSICRGSSALPTSHSSSQLVPATTHLAKPDLERLGRSTTSQLRTLSTLAQSESAEDFAITTPAQEVVGLRGRRRLQRSAQASGGRGVAGVGGGSYAWEGRNWMDKQRQFLAAYEYLCHIGEAKEWIEDITHKDLPAIVDLEEALRDGVTLAEVVEALEPDGRRRIFRHPRLQYRHSDNIAIFFRYLDEVQLPDLFRFELIDLYEKKNIPKVIYCVHALSWLLFRKGIVDFRIGNLVGQLEFEHHELEAVQKGLDKLGVNMPSFGNMGADFGVEPEPEPEPEPEETEEERIDRELGENEAIIVDLQAQARGAMARMRLGATMERLWDSEGWLVDLQSRIRGDFSRQIIGYRLEMRRFAVNLQSAARGFLVRRRQENSERFWEAVEPDILELQSLIRARRVRDKVCGVRSQLERQAGPLRDIQAMCRGLLVRKAGAAQEEETTRAAGGIERLQGAVRGMQLRRGLAEEQRLLGGQAEATTALQAFARAALTRGHIADEREQLESFTPAWVALQGLARAALTRGHIADEREQLKSSTPAWVALQGLARAALTRGRIADERRQLESFTPAWVALQAFARAALTRGHIADEREQLESFTPAWVALQGLARGSLVRSETKALKAELKCHSPQVTLIQSFVRASAVRRAIEEKLSALHENEESVVELQSLIRGMIMRRQRMEDQESLIRQEAKIRLLQARMRGCLHRRRHSELLDELHSHTEEVTALQGLARAMLLRAEIGDLLSELDAAHDSTTDFQAAARAHLVRARFREKRRFFRENMQKVVKIQSFVRAKIQGEAYKSLTTGKDPPVGAVKSFVHLLNDSDFDFNEEVEFERMRKTVVQQVRQNEMLEQYIDQLDIKIALLVKNKITLDEVVSHQHALGGHAVSMIANSSMASTNQFDLKALNRSSRKKLESYQQLFFNLQTQPQYLARLFRRIREQGMAEKESRRVELLVMSLFGWAQKRREEYYLLKLVARSIREEVEGSASLQAYVRGNYFWPKLVANYTRSPRDRKYLRDLLGPLIRDNIVEDPALDLESDPAQIYRSAINGEELRTGRPSRRPLDVPREVAIQDPETRDLFIDHLRDLREICDQFLAAFEDLLPRLPYGMRFMCRAMFESLCEHFPGESQHQVLFVVSNWLWRFYLRPALTAPEGTGVMERQLSPLQKRNLGEVAKVLGQAASGRLFGGDNVYLQPLNAFVGSSVERFGAVMGELIAVPDAESTFDIDEYNDLYAKNKPTLYIKMADVFAIHGIVAAELAHVCPPGGGGGGGGGGGEQQPDVVREMMRELGSAKSNESEMTAATAHSDIQMSLTPRLRDVEDPEAEIKTLFMETKRCVLYIIRVQQGPSLLDILVRPITAEDEVRWRTLLQDDFSGGGGGGGAAGSPGTRGTKGAYSDANMVDVTRMAYHELKRTALENVLRLEQMGRISKRNRYQDILNAIASDIRTKSRRRVQRQRELEGVRLTLGNLHEKAKYLEQQRKSYDDYIESAMATLQKNKGKKRFLVPFTKQYNHQRELERSGRVPKFGSYKYSVRSLSERGCIVSWKGVAERDWDKTNLTISCDEVGAFLLEGSKGSIQIPGASAVLSIEDLLTAQFEARQFMEVFEGCLRMNVNLVLHLLYKKFYRTQ